MGDALVMQVMATTRGDVHLMNTLTKWSARAGDSIPAMTAIGEFMEERTKELFESEGGSAGRPWREVDEDTIKARREDTSGKILQDSGDLLRSLTVWSDPNALRDIGPGFIRFGSKLAYAEMHRRGFRNRHGQRVPARRPIDFTPRDRYIILKILGGWITGRTRVDIRPGLRFIR